MREKHRKRRDNEPEDNEDNDEPLNVSRPVNVTVDLGGGSAPRTAEVELPSSVDKPTEDKGEDVERAVTVDRLIDGFVEAMRGSDDYSDQLFADEVAAMYNRPGTIVERRTSNMLIPTARTANVESLDSEFSFSLGADHVGGGALSPLPTILRSS